VIRAVPQLIPQSQPEGLRLDDARDAAPRAELHVERRAEPERVAALQQALRAEGLPTPDEYGVGIEESVQPPDLPQALLIVIGIAIDRILGPMLDPVGVEVQVAVERVHRAVARVAGRWNNHYIVRLPASDGDAYVYRMPSGPDHDVAWNAMFEHRLTHPHGSRRRSWRTHWRWVTDDEVAGELY